MRPDSSSFRWLFLVVTQYLGGHRDNLINLLHKKFLSLWKL
jgi:hypothetical protein